MPKKFKLSSGVSHEYTIFGISCHLKDYRFTFFLNEQLGFRFKRIDDLNMTDGKESRAYSFYSYHHADERRNYYLVTNYHETGRLIPTEKGADFFLIVEGLLPPAQKKRMVKEVKAISHVLAAYEIPEGKAKNLDVIFGEIEMHLL